MFVFKEYEIKEDQWYVSEEGIIVKFRQAGSDLEFVLFGELEDWEVCSYFSFSDLTEINIGEPIQKVFVPVKGKYYEFSDNKVDWWVRVFDSMDSDDDYPYNAIECCYRYVRKIDASNIG